MFGTHTGLYIPDDLQIGAGVSSVLLIVEGGSDACAGFDMGLPTVGRFSCTGQTDMLADLARAMNPSVMVIVGDSDGPGRAGAERLARALRPLVRALKVIEPPAGHKDLRAWHIAGATDGDLIRLINETPPQPLRLEVVTHAR
jgi:DNA primase